MLFSFLQKHKVVPLLFVITIIYSAQFIVIPYCFPQYYPVSNESTTILLAPIVVISVVASTVFDVNIKVWVIVDIVYGIMMSPYNGEGMYGIGLRGVMLDGAHPTYSLELAILTVLIMVIVSLAFQGLVRTIRLTFLKLKRCRHM